MGIDANPKNTKAMVCTPWFIWGKWGETAYKQQVTGEGATFRERNSMRVSCTKYIVTVEELYLKAHMEIIHGIYAPQTRGFDKVGGGPITYVVSFPRVLQTVKCPVPGCTLVAHSAGRLRENFMYHHFSSKVAAVQEGVEPLTCYELCGIQIQKGWIIKHW